ncbi:MAG: endo-1,4-beta-xylanase [Oscillospiraceae bacterium]|jgi:GH35 family endo-1,4-beta-xylanase|nr:endo-1,4-beta-xylanase [Oscillospiraceae bacterium]
MKKKLLSLLICVVLLISLIPAAAVYQERDGETLLFNFTFDPDDINVIADSTSYADDWFSYGDSVNATWVSGADVGHQNDGHALRLEHIEGSSYMSYDTMMRLSLPTNYVLPAGASYRIFGWIYVPSDENQGKESITGPGIVINQDYAGAFGVMKFPVDNPAPPITMDEWHSFDFVIPASTFEIEELDFRIVANTGRVVPDVWYWDNIEIWQVGERDENIRLPAWDLSLPSLYEAYADFFQFGNIMTPSAQWFRTHSDNFFHHFNTVTAENAMKPEYIGRARDDMNFHDSDIIVDWAETYGLALHGHALLWHSQSARWFTYNEDGTVLTRAEARENLEFFITEYAGRYAGRIASWDVVNEVLDTSATDNPWFENLRTGTGRDMSSAWYTAYANGADSAAGERPYDYIYDAFVFARRADPKAVLFYNDFNEETPAKREAMASMVEYFNAKWKDDPQNTEPDRLLIEGIGMQAHYWVGQLSPSQVRASIERFVETGARIRITELDIPFGTWSNQRDPNAPPATVEELQKQADLYRDLFEIFVEFADHIDAVTIWGLADPMSWRGNGLPLLFDEWFAPKPAFFSVLEVAQGSVSPEDPTPDPDDNEKPDDNNNGNNGDIVTPPTDDKPNNASTDDWTVLIIIGISVVILATLGFIIFKVKKSKKN